MATCALAFSISVSDGSNRSASWTITQLLPASLWSTRPRTSTISSAAITCWTASSVFSKTTISTLPSRSSSVANIIGVPVRVRIFFDSVIIPPTFTQSPSRCSGSWAQPQSAFTRSASRTRFSGCSVMNTPTDSRSSASSSGRSYSCVGIGGCAGVNAVVAAAPPRPPRSKIEPWPIWASSWTFWPAACADSSTSSIPRRVAPVEPNAPHLISASIAFLFTARQSTRSQKSHRLVNGSLSRARLIASTAA